MKYKPVILIISLLLFVCSIQAQDNQNYKPKLVPPIGHTYAINSANFSPDEKFIITAGDKTAKVWDVNTGKLIHNLTGHSSNVVSAQYTADGKYMVTQDSFNYLIIYDAHSGEYLFDIYGYWDFFKTIQFSPDGKQITVLSDSCAVTVWDLPSQKPMFKLDGMYPKIWSVAYNEKGNKIVTTSTNGLIKTWNAKTGKLNHRIEAHTDTTRARYSPNGKLIASSSLDGTVKIWKSNNGKIKSKISGYTAGVNLANFSPNGKQLLILTLDGIVTVRNINSGNFKYKLNTPLRLYPEFNPLGSQIATANDDIISLWNGDNGEKLWDLKSNSFISKNENLLPLVDIIKYSPNGEKIASRVSNYDLDQEGIVTGVAVNIWDTETGNLLCELKDEKHIISTFQFSKNGKYIITISRKYFIQLWDANTGELIHNLTGHIFPIKQTMLSDDKEFLKIWADGQPFRFWNLKSGKPFFEKNISTFSTSDSLEGPVFTSKPETNNLNLIEYVDEIASEKFPDEILKEQKDTSIAEIKMPASDTIVETAMTELPKHEEIDILFIDQVSSSMTVQDLIYDTLNEFSLISRYENVYLIEKDSESEIQLIGHTDYITNASFFKKGNLIITGSFDGSLKFWDRIGNLLLTIYPVDTSDWVVVHPSGLFDASPNAMKLMHFTVGTELIELDQLKERYYEPHLFRKVIHNEGNIRSVKEFENLKMYPQIDAFINNNQLIINLKKRNGGLGKVSISANGKEIIPDANTGRNSTITLPLGPYSKYFVSGQSNTLSVRAYNEDGWLKSSAFTLTHKPEELSSKGDGTITLSGFNTKHEPELYAVIVGTSNYNGDKLKLKYADKDSKYMASAIKQSANKLFGEDHTHITWLSTDSDSLSIPSSKENIKKVFSSIAKTAKSSDILLIYFSGHGVSWRDNEKEQFHYLTKDVVTGDISDPTIRVNYTISSEDLTNWIRDIAALKQVMIIDACNSGKIVDDLSTERDLPSSQIRALDRMKDRTGMFVLAGSAADKVSYEASQFGQGLLTYSLLMGMSGDALKDEINVDVSQLFNFARDKVPFYARGIGGVQTPTLFANPGAASFEIGIVNDDVNIPIEEIKPIFIRSNFQDQENYIDEIELSQKVDEKLDEISYSGSQDIIFVDVRKKRNAYAIRGQYFNEGNEIVVNARLYKNKTNLGKFQIREGKENIGTLVEEIIEKAGQILNKIE